MHFNEMIVSRHYCCVDRHGETLYIGDDTTHLRLAMPAPDANV
jgi:hypothetical protein